MKKKLLLSLFLLGFSLSSAFAAGLAGEVQDAYRKTDYFQADFIQKTFVEVLDRDTEEVGTLLFSKPGRFAIRYQGKREREYLSDGETLWIYHPREKEVEIFEDVKDVISREALAFLGGLGGMSKEFKVKEDQKAKNYLILIPRSSASPFSKIILKIDPHTHLVSEATLFPKSGNRSHYIFSSVRVNEPTPPGTFHFKKNGVKEIRPLAVQE
jgi:outer membrane lipoprotein carrier protein